MNKNLVKWRQTSLLDKVYLIYVNEAEYGRIMFQGLTRADFKSNAGLLSLKVADKRGTYIIQDDAGRRFARVHNDAIISELKGDRYQLDFSHRFFISCSDVSNNKCLQIGNPDPENNGWGEITAFRDISGPEWDVLLLSSLFLRRNKMLKKVYAFGIATLLFLLTLIGLFQIFK